MSTSPPVPGLKNDDIAIIGMAGRFPGAASVDAFWTNVRDGVESIRALTDDELIAAGVSRSVLSDPDYVKACPVLDDVDMFDASFFGLSPREASVMDPAHRIFLEIAWQAVENAGYSASPDEGPVGVFAGAGAPSYFIENLRSNPDLMHAMGDFLVRHTGNDMNFLATRVSYEMDLRGPSMNIQTACSSALVSVHLACQSLARGECTMALAGGSTVLFPQGLGYHFKEGEILSPDGHCRPFDAKSAGTVFGSGAGVVVLKRLSAALDDGDTIHAVIKGSAINNDGAMKVGYLAPGVDGQAAVIASALASCDVDVDSISYIETHGTGTLVGDPIEVEALNEAFRRVTERRRFCAIGSVKSNIGHLGEAAGVASLIKVVMALKNRQLPPSLGYETPNPAIDFDDSPFFVNASLRAWEGEGPLRCGITALGAGGTNCHMILEEAPRALPGEGERSQQLLVVSAKSKAALDQACDNLATRLEAKPALDLADVAFTLAVGRRSMTHRRALAARTVDEAVAGLRDRTSKTIANDVADDTRAKTVFMFPGGGAQYAGMGAELYEREDVYREAIDACLDIINPAIGRDLRPLMFPKAGDVEAATRTLEQPSLTLPSLFATEYAMARLFQSWGVTADAFIGHSVGEYTAACLAGVMNLEDTLRLVMMRGRLFECAERGSMLSVPMGEADLRAILPIGLDIAAANAPDLSVASGPTAAIKSLEALLTEREIDSTAVRIDVAAHSAMLDPVLGQFRDLCRTISFNPPRTPFVSNVTGKWITTAEATSPEYWVTHLRSTVRFAAGLESLREIGEPILLEAGPGRTLCMLARAQAKPFRKAFNCIRHPQEPASDLGYALTSLGRLWCAGGTIDWTAFYDGQLRNRVPLPAYPFERKSFWVKPGKVVGSSASKELVRRDDVGEWFYSLRYLEAPVVADAAEREPRTWLILSEDVRAGRRMARSLAPEKVLVACPGRTFVEKLDGIWRLDFDKPEHYAAILRHMEEHVGIPDHVVLLTGPSKARNGADPSLVSQNFLRPVYLMQALGALDDRMQVSIVTSGLTGVGGERVVPIRSLVLGPALVSPREFDNLTVRCIDLPARAGSSIEDDALLGRLMQELRAESNDRVVALSSGGRWIREAGPLPLPASSQPAGWVRENGVYLITGGLGGIGLEVAAHIARTKKVKLILMARGGLPPEAEWGAILGAQGASRAAGRIAKVRALRQTGAEVLVVNADVADKKSVSDALAQARRAFGPLTGVIHAAGVMDDALMMTKSDGAMIRVLTPKVAGTLNLDSLIGEDLDFFMLFSSVASYLGLPGQVDYTAANAFQDAFARERSIRASGRTVVVNWNAWRDIGMAATAHAIQVAGAPPEHPSLHPALDGFTDGAEGRRFVATLSQASSWMLAEHVVRGGAAILPGTAFVELARAAYVDGRTTGAIELSDLTFITPFRVEGDESKRLTIQMTPSGAGHVISIYAGPDTHGQAIVHGEARPYTGKPPAALDLAAIRERCREKEFAPQDGRLNQDFMTFGPRWANIRRISFGSGEALAEVSLDDRFVGDLDGYGLHPAVLDMATGGAQALIPGVDLTREFYVPLAYGAIRVFGQMPSRVFSHVRCLTSSGNGVAFFDITLSDADGRVFADISRFTMKRLDPGASLGAPASGRSVERARNDPMATMLREAISAPEGLEALDRIMAQPGIVQAMASSVDVNLWNAQLSLVTAPRNEQELSLEGFQRPDLASDYIAPTSRTEQALAKIWSELLGVRHVGINDNFFDLGGNSLSGVRLFGAIRKQFQVTLPLATLFEAQSIAELAALLPQDSAGPPQPEAAAGRGWSPLVRIKAGSPGVTPFFFIHGSRGNVLLFKTFADKFGADQPVYALQARGVDGNSPPEETIEAMAASYLAAIRTAQPSGPYILAGYSGGGIIGYEITRLLKQTGEAAEILMLIDTLEPSEMLRPVSIMERIQNLHRVKMNRFLALPRTLWRYQIQSRLQKLMKVQKIEAPRTAIEAASDAVSAAYYRAQEAYEPKPLATDIVVIRATDARIRFLRCGPTLGWDKHVDGEIHCFDVDTDHDHVFDEPAVSQFAEIFRGILERNAALKRRHAASTVQTPNAAKLLSRQKATARSANSTGISALGDEAVLAEPTSVESR